MLNSKWSPVFAPEVEAGVDDVDPGAAPPPKVDDKFSDGPGSGRTKLRHQLEGNFKKASDAADKAEKAEAVAEKKPAREGRPGAVKSRARQEMDALSDDENLDVEVEEPKEEVEGEEVEKPASKYTAPAAWTKEAKAEWAKVPANVQAAVAKREADIAKGIDQIKAHYGELDAIITPRMEMLKAANQTPAQAINHLFGWFEQLNMDSQRVQNGQAPTALLALAHSLGIDLTGMQQKPAEAAPAEELAAGEAPAVHPQVAQYIQQLEQKLNQLEQNVTGGFNNFNQTIQQQAQHKTNEILNVWSNGKPYFEEVRKDMAYIIGTGMIPAKEDGSADLDTAYERALYFNPEVREKVLADRRKAALDKKKAAAEKETAAQQAEANRARRAQGSLAPSAPGATFAKDGKSAKKVKSVRESIADAMGRIGQLMTWPFSPTGTFPLDAAGTDAFPGKVLASADWNTCFQDITDGMTTLGENIAKSTVFLYSTSSVNLNASNAEIAVSISLPTGFTKYVLDSCTIYNTCSISTLTAATIGVFNVTGGGGLALCATQALSGIISNTVNTDANAFTLAQTIGNRTVVNSSVLYVRVSVGQSTGNATANATAYVVLRALP